MKLRDELPGKLSKRCGYLFAQYKQQTGAAEKKPRKSRDPSLPTRPYNKRGSAPSLSAKRKSAAAARRVAGQAGVSGEQQHQCNQWVPAAATRQQQPVLHELQPSTSGSLGPTEGSRLTGAYMAALEGLQRLVPGFQPRKVICDFEKPQKAAWRNVHPNTEVQGCYFHLAKAVCEKVKELGFRLLVQQDMHADSIL
ncbi:Phosphopentomutase [Frankliniella fusca]|uniref:Phosphopentomutase n=1 Tax=Frankliniella fusca TaxID=407009 RepID=A0AAE1H213_9NEOP|nr:Phosphopentomutase [Frankliniella fusca]